MIDDDGAEVYGPFRLHPPVDDPKVTGRPDTWPVSWSQTWLPGRYATRDAALVACGYVLGGEGRGFLDYVRDKAAGPIEVRHFTDLNRSAPDAEGVVPWERHPAYRLLTGLYEELECPGNVDPPIHERDQACVAASSVQALMAAGLLAEFPR